MMPWLRKGGDCRSPFHKPKIIEKNNKKNLLLITERTASCSLPMLTTYQKSPADGLCFIRWAGSPKSAEVLVRKMRLMPMGQHCSNQLFSRDLFLKHLPILFQYRLAEGKDKQLQGKICTPLQNSKTSCAGGDTVSASSLTNVLMLLE